MENTEKKITLVDINTAMSLAKDAHDNTDTMIACEYLDTMGDMDTTFAEYNKGLLADAYSEMKTPADVMKRAYYSPLHSQWDKKTKAYVAMSRKTRLNVLDFIAKKELDSTLPEKVKALADKLAAFIKSEVTYDGKGKKSVSVKEVVPMLSAVVEEIGIDGVYARVRDVRFLAYSCTGGSASIGSLRKVEVSRVAALLVDVYHVQLSGGAYDFEKKETENK